jgi:DNA-binding beta-propeller fold protein YncE
MNLNPSYGLNRIIATIPLPKYPDLPKDQAVKENLGCPEAVVIVGDKAYITLANLNKKDFVAGGPGFVALVDLQSNQFLSTIQTTGRNTIGLCLDPFNNQKLYVLSAGDINPSTWIYDGNGKIDVLDIGLLGITSSIDVNGAPFEMLVAPNGMGYITDGMEGKILTLDTSTHYFRASIELAVEGEMGYASGLALLGGDFLFALEFNQDELVIIDLKTSNMIVDRIKTGDGPDAITILP